MTHPAEEDVAKIPSGVRGKIDGIAPAAIGRVDRRIANAKADGHSLAHVALRRQFNLVELQISRWWRLDAQRLQGRRPIVLVEAELLNIAVGSCSPHPPRIGGNEDVITAGQVDRGCERELLAVAASRRQAATMAHVAKETVLVDIQEPVLGEIDQVIPLALIRRGLAALVFHLIVNRERLAGQHGIRSQHRGDLQIRWGRQANGQGDLNAVIAFIRELEYGIRAVRCNCWQSSTDGADGRLIWIANFGGICLENQLEITTDGGWEREACRIGDRFTRMQEAGLPVAIQR